MLTVACSCRFLTSFIYRDIQDADSQHVLVAFLPVLDADSQHVLVGFLPTYIYIDIQDADSQHVLVGFLPTSYIETYRMVTVSMFL